MKRVTASLLIGVLLLSGCGIWSVRCADYLRHGTDPDFQLAV